MTKTFICLHCFTQVDVNAYTEIKSVGLECPICKCKTVPVPDNANVTLVKYHLERLREAMYPEEM